MPAPLKLCRIKVNRRTDVASLFNAMMISIPKISVINLIFV